MPEEGPQTTNRRLWLELGLCLLVIWAPLALGGRLISNLSYDTPGMVLYSIVSLTGYVALVHFLVWRSGEPFRRLAWRKIRPCRELMYTVLLLIGAWMLAYAYARMWPASPSDPGSAGLLGPLTFLNIASLLIAAMFEESFYRGLIWDRVRRLSKSRALTLISSSALFAAAHPYNFRDSGWVFVFGLLFGLARLGGRSLTRLTLAHWGFNVALFF
jgi:membrane protease YdiL (CAAX protease family)